MKQTFDTPEEAINGIGGRTEERAKARPNGHDYGANGQQEPDTDPTLFRLLDMADIRSIPTPKWLIPGLLIEKTLAATYGPPKSLKSFVVLDALLRLAYGLDWRGEQLQQTDVLYVCAEGWAASRRVSRPGSDIIELTVTRRASR